MTQKCTVIIEGTFKQGMEKSPEFIEYSKKSNENGEMHGGIVLKKFVVSENLGTGETPNFILFIEYPTRKKVIKAFSNSHYLRLLEMREQIFKEVKILVEK